MSSGYNVRHNMLTPSPRYEFLEKVGREGVENRTKQALNAITGKTSFAQKLQRSDDSFHLHLRTASAGSWDEHHARCSHKTGFSATG